MHKTKVLCWLIRLAKGGDDAGGATYQSDGKGVAAERCDRVEHPEEERNGIGSAGGVAAILLAKLRCQRLALSKYLVYFGD